MNDTAVELAFLESWDGAELFYQESASSKNFAWLEPMIGFVEQLRIRGYDRLFRHGHALYFLVLSRSLEHGLRNNQPSITFRPNPDGGMTVYCELRGTRGVVPRVFSVPTVTLTPELDQLIQRLAREAID